MGVQFNFSSFLKSINLINGVFVRTEHIGSVNQPNGQVTFFSKIDGSIAMLPCVSLNYYSSCDECAEAYCKIKSVFEKVRDKTLKILTTTYIETTRSKI